MESGCVDDPGVFCGVKDPELHFHLINLLPETVSLQLQLKQQPKVSYAEPIGKAREL